MRCHDPSPPKAGPGMALGKCISGKRTRLKRKHRRKAIVASTSLANDAAAQFANDDEFCLSFHDEEENQDPKVVASTAAATTTATSTGTSVQDGTTTTTTTNNNNNNNSSISKKSKKVNFFKESSSSSSEEEEEMEEEQPKKQARSTKEAAVDATVHNAYTKAARSIVTGALRPSSRTQATVSSTTKSSINTSAPPPSKRRFLNSITAPKLKTKTTTTTTTTTSNSKSSATTTKTKKKLPTASKKKNTSTTALPAVLTPKSNPTKGRPAVTVQKDATSLSSKASSPRPSTVIAASATSSFPTPSTMNITNRCAIGFDTRFLETDEGQETGRELVDECRIFLESLSSRGATPCILATSIAKEKTKTGSSTSVASNSATSARGRRNAVAVRAWTTSTMAAVGSGIDGDGDGNRAEDDPVAHDGVVPIWIAPPINNANKVNRKAVHVPKPLLANDSWKHLGEMVEAIIEEDAKGRIALKKKPRPLDITLVSNDLSLFCDTNQASHKRAISRFWDLVKPFFQDGTVQSIHIAMAKTGAVALPKPPSEDANLSPSTTVNQDDRYPKDENENGTGGEDKQDEEAARKTEEAEARSMHEISIANCIRSLQEQLLTRAEDDYKNNRSNYAAIHNPIPPVDITLSTVDATAHARLGFKALLRRCLRDVVSSVTTLSIGKPQSRIRLELPETMDGTQCSISFDVTYKTLPFALDRPGLTQAFFADLGELADSKLEVVQLVPMSCIDASLLFGVPMSVRTGLEDDFEQYQEVLVLVRSLFRLMQEKDVAVLLRIQEKPQDNNGGKRAPTTFHNGIFHSPNRAQTFLLMGEEVVAGSSPPTTGILFRYASAEELLLEQERPFPKSETSVPGEVVKQYESYVENALDILDCNPVNPLYLDATSRQSHAKQRNSNNSSSPASSYEDSDKIWNDKVGVGALVDLEEGKKAMGELSLEDPDEMSVDDDDEGNFYAFDYS